MTTPLIAIVNQAGGVGKTTLARDLGYEFAQSLSVLLIDGDSQGSLGEFLGLNPHEKPSTSLFWNAVAGGTTPEVFAAFGMDVGIANQEVFIQRERIREQFDPNLLLRAMDGLMGQYDLILLDCPPDINEITTQILQASDWVLIPVQTEAKAVWGFDILQAQIAKANNRRKGLKPPLKVLGLIPTLYRDDRRLHKHYLGEIKRVAQMYDYEVFPPFRNFIAVTEACNYMKPLSLYNSNCPALDDIRRICSTISAKLNLSEIRRSKAIPV